MVFTFSTILKASVCLFTMMISFHLLPGHAQIDIDAALSTDVSESTQSESDSSIQLYDEHGDIGALEDKPSTQDLFNHAQAGAGDVYIFEPPPIDSNDSGVSTGGNGDTVNETQAPRFEDVLTPAIQASKKRNPIKAKLKQRKQALKALDDDIERLSVRMEVVELKRTQAQLKIEKLNARSEKLNLKRAAVEARLASPDLAVDTREALEGRLITITEREAQLDERLLQLEDRLARLAIRLENAQSTLSALGFVESDLSATSATDITQG